MSHDATSWARTQKTGSMSAKFILMRLADYAGTDYSCYPSVAKLAEECEMGESTVRAATKLLAELGLIRVFYRHRAGGLRRSCRYQLLVEGPDTAEPDADDWADYRRISADANRQNPADQPPDLSGSVRQISADIPSSDPSLKEPPPLIPAAARRKATRVPDDFRPDESMRAWYRENVGALLDGRVEHEKFMDYWRAMPGVRGQKLDWPATWRNWMRSAAERVSRRVGSAVVPVSGSPYRPGASTTDDRVMQGLSLVAKYRKMEEQE